MSAGNGNLPPFGKWRDFGQRLAALGQRPAGIRLARPWPKPARPRTTIGPRVRRARPPGSGVRPPRSCNRQRHASAASTPGRCPIGVPGGLLSEQRFQGDGAARNRSFLLGSQRLTQEQLGRAKASKAPQRHPPPEGAGVLSGTAASPQPPQPDRRRPNEAGMNRVAAATAGARPSADCGAARPTPCVSWGLGSAEDWRGLNCSCDPPVSSPEVPVWPSTTTHKQIAEMDIGLSPGKEFGGLVEDSGLALGLFAAYAIEWPILVICVKTKQSWAAKKSNRFGKFGRSIWRSVIT